MKIQLATVTIGNVIVHTIPKHAKNDLSVTPKCSKIESKLSHGLRLFLKEKIVQALSSDKSYKICFKNDTASPMLQARNSVLKNKTNFVDESIKLAQHLFNVQIGSNAAGILVFVFGTINTKNTCFIIKLEMDKGLQLKLDEETDSYDIAEVEDLMLTQKTKIFKVAMFIAREDFDSDFDGNLTDYQIDIKTKKDSTTWFIDKFLNCIPYEDPKITTKRFYNLSRDFITTISDPVEQAKCLQDLNSYVQKNNHTLNPQEFAEDYLNSPELMDTYKNYLIDNGFEFHSFNKDISHIERLVKKIMITFDNDVSIIGTKGILDEKVKLEQLVNGQTKAEIISRIKKIA